MLYKYVVYVVLLVFNKNMLQNMKKKNISLVYVYWLWINVLNFFFGSRLIIRG